MDMKKEIPVSSPTKNNNTTCLDDNIDIPQKGMEEDGLMKKVITWKEFIENTTLHGVKYIFEDDCVLIRR